MNSFVSYCETKENTHKEISGKPLTDAGNVPSLEPISCGCGELTNAARMRKSKQVGGAPSKVQLSRSGAAECGN